MKQIIVIRNDLKLPKGKLAGQTAHASVENVFKMQKKHSDILKEWHETGMKKIVAKVDSLKELLKVRQEAEDLGLETCVIKDAGKTVVSPGTITCIGIGPDEDDKIDIVCSKLKLV